MTKSELDQIGQSLLSQYNMNSIAQQAIDAAARHGLTLTRKEIKDILAYLRLLANEKDDAAHLRVINTPPRAIGKTTVETVLERVRNGDGTFWQVLVSEANGTGRSAPKLKGFTDLVQGWKNLVAAGETPLPILAEHIIADTGYKEFLRKEDELTADERIANIDEMVNGKGVFYRVLGMSFGLKKVFTEHMNQMGMGSNSVLNKFSTDDWSDYERIGVKACIEEFEREIEKGGSGEETMPQGKAAEG